MARVRHPLQGVWNIIRFNWPFYLFALGLLLLAGIARNNIATDIRGYVNVGIGLLVLPLISSLAVSFYVYDVSSLYSLAWLPPTPTPSSQLRLLTISAGFDEASPLLQAKLRPAHLVAFDFYDPARHTEASIKRARQAYPPFPGTQQVSTRTLPLPDGSVDEVVAFLSAHEIRDEGERQAFFRELRRIIKPTGRIVITEHLRDPANFLAYTIGFFHFHSHATWRRTFQAADLQVAQEIKITPFITTFLLTNRGATA